jgi:hypothetical protein
MNTCDLDAVNALLNRLVAAVGGQESCTNVGIVSRCKQTNDELFSSATLSVHENGATLEVSILNLDKKQKVYNRTYTDGCDITRVLLRHQLQN